MDPIPQWSLLQYGDSVDAVVRILVKDGLKILGCTMDYPSRAIIIKGDISPEIFSRDTVVLLNSKVVEVKPTLTLEIGGGSYIQGLPACDVSNMQQVVELCSGIGIWSSMAHYVDFKCLAGVDTNQRWEQIFHLLHSSSNFLVGECGDGCVIRKLLESNGAFATVLAGINCQPHSTGGDQKGFQDERAQSLPKALRAIWLMQSQCAVLECVPSIMRNPEAQQMLQQFCKQTRMTMTQGTLQLSDIWCAKRERWFAILTSQVLGEVKIPPLPKGDQFDVIKKVMPYIKTWGEHDMTQIQLSLYELSTFNAYAVGGLCNLFLQPEGILPTSLHSTSNQLYPCACGCRQAFSLQRLQSRGLYGVLIPLGTNVHHDYKILPECRYPHPVELFLLNGGDPSQTFGDSLRLANAGIGQCVSPIHGLWILVHVANAIRQMRSFDLFIPQQVLHEYLSKVCANRDQQWPHIQAPLSDSVGVTFMDFEHQSQIVIQIPRGLTAEAFLQIEANFRGDQSVIATGLFVGTSRLDDQAMLTEFPVVSFGQEPQQHSQECRLKCPCEQWNTEANEASLNNHVPAPAAVTFEGPPIESISPTLPFSVNETSPVLALSKLENTDFLEMIPPKISDVGSIEVQLNTQISKADRLQVLHQQQDVWADDEIRFAFEVLASSYHHDTIPLFAWDPLFITSIIRFGHLNALEGYTAKLPTTAYVMTAVNVEGHWYPLLWKRHENCLMGLTCGHTYDISVALQAVHATVARFLKCPCLPLQFTRMPFVVDQCCGALTAHYLAAEIFQQPLVSNMTDLRMIHDSLRHDFCQALLESTPRPWTWGRGEIQPQVMLKALLLEHGVPESAVEDRVQHVVHQVGLSNIVSALQSPVPWKELKWAANRVVPMVQLILPSELKDQVAKKGQTMQIGNRANKKTKGKASGKGTPSSKKIDPTSLRIEDGIFTCGEGIPLQQVELSQVGPTASGVVLCSVQAALPFLKSSRPVSAGGLALIIVDDPEVPFPPMIPVEHIRLPVICTANSQPLLIDGRMIQMGSQQVVRKPQTEKFELVSIASSVVKIMVFRDQTTVDWSQVVAHPLKHIFARLPMLQKCRIEGCAQDCEAWHAAEACQLEDPILEIWNRQWLSLGFVAKQPEHAELYTAHFRIPHCLQRQIQSYSGVDGVFCEPKDVDGKSPSTAFHVVWLPRCNFEDVLVYKQTIQGICGVARMSSKFGVRCLVADAARVHEAVRPGIPYLPPGRKEFYIVGPVPFGTLKSSLAQVFQSFQWRARPVQPTPAAPHIAGLMWKVQAVEEPPVSVIPTEHGEMVVSKVGEVVQSNVPKSGIVGSTSTVQLCTAPQTSQDPLQLYDPWADWSKASAHVVKQPAVDPVEILEQKVLDAVVAKIPSQGSQQTHLQSRVDALEQKVAEIAESQVRVQSTVQEQGRQHQQQMAHIEAAVSDQANKLVGFQQQFRAQLEQQQGHLDGLFQQQLTKIEDLISGHKKQRRESPGPH